MSLRREESVRLAPAAQCQWVRLLGPRCLRHPCGGSRCHHWWGFGGVHHVVAAISLGCSRHWVLHPMLLSASWGIVCLRPGGAGSSILTHCRVKPCWSGNLWSGHKRGCHNRSLWSSTNSHFASGLVGWGPAAPIACCLFVCAGTLLCR